MKHLTITVLLLALAGPVAAFDRGDCCASVGNVCISTCERSSCTGQGDCELALTSRPAGTTSSTPEIQASYRTMSHRDQQALDRLMNPPDPPGSGGRDDEDPAEGGLATPEGTGSHEPALAQTGGSSAQVPMMHGSCGLDCGTHVLAVAGGNLDTPFTISMSCPAGTEVEFLAYLLEGAGQVEVVSGPTGSKSFSESLDLQPFSMGELEEACRVALGGGWPLPGQHKNTEKVVTTDLQEPIKVWGQCTGWANQLLRIYPVELEVSCDDQSWVP